MASDIGKSCCAPTSHVIYIFYSPVALVWHLTAGSNFSFNSPLAKQSDRMQLAASHQGGVEQEASHGEQDPFDQESFHLKFPKREAGHSFDSHLKE